VSPEPAKSGEPSAKAACTHPWLLVTCGACGAPVDELRPADAPDPARPSPTVTHAVLADSATKLFIVARGHPELVEQLKALMGDAEAIQVIEDRRLVDRTPAGPEGQAAPSRETTEFRRRVREATAGDDY
jgi:hypothetical protein